MASAGLVAALAAAAPRAASYLRGLRESEQGSEVSVSTDNFRLLRYDRAALDRFIDEASGVYGVSADLVSAVIQTESAFDPLAVSPVGAQGLMQLMPGTAEHMGVKNPFDARENIFGGVKYLSILLDRFHGNTALALASYNAGPSVVDRHKGIPPYGETRGYVKKIRELVADTASAFSLPAPPRPPRRALLARHGRAATRLARAAEPRAATPRLAKATGTSRRGTAARLVRYQGSTRRASRTVVLRKGASKRPTMSLAAARAAARRTRSGRA